MTDPRSTSKNTSAPLPSDASYSQAYTAAVCLRKFLLRYICKIPEVPTDRMLHGGGVHKGLALLNKKRRAGESVHQDDLMALYTGPHKKRAERELKKCTEFSEKWDHEPKHIEAHCSLVLSGPEIPDTRVRGYIDLVARERSDAVIDYKVVGKTPPQDAARKSIQLALYAHATGTDSASLIHVWNDRHGALVMRQRTQITPQRVTNAMHFLGGVEKMIRTCAATNSWPRRVPDFTCNSCYLRGLCWNGEKHPYFEKYKELYGDPDD